MNVDGVIKLSKEAQRQNELERLKRKFNNVNNDTSVSFHDNHSLNSSMLSLTITQNSTSFEYENNRDEHSKNLINSNNQIIQGNQINIQGKIRAMPKRNEEIAKLKSAKKKTNLINEKTKSIKSSNKTSKSNLKINSKSYITYPKSNSNSTFFQNKNSDKNQNFKTNANKTKPLVVNSNIYNSTSYLSPDKEIKPTSLIEQKTKNTNSSHVKINQIPEKKSSKLTIISQSILDKSQTNQNITDESQMTQIIPMNNLNTDKLITNDLLKKNSSSSEKSFFIKTEIEENSFNLDEKNKSYMEGNQQSQDIGNEHSIESEKIPSDHGQSLVLNKYNYTEKIKSITHFQAPNKTNTKDTEVFEIENDADDSYHNNLRYEITNQTHSYSIINTIDRDNIFYNNPSWLLSNRLINDEKNYLNRQITLNNPDYKFLGKIREDSEKAIVLKTKLFLKLNEDSMFNLLSFIFDQYKVITQINKLIQRKICLTLNSKFERVVREFKEMYSDVLELQEFYFKHSEIKKPKGYFNGVNMGFTESSVIDLVLKSRIVSKMVNKCIEISFMHKTSGKEFIQTWSFDLKKKSDIGIWFASEAEENANRIKRVCYYQPILSFYKGDSIEFRINIFSNMGVIEPNSIKWIEIRSYDTPVHNFIDYEKSLVKSNVQFDKLRCCELENIIHVWKNEKSLSRKENISEFKKIFKNNFKITDIDYDIAKFYIFKIKMKADKIGIIRKNKFVNVDIEIKSWDDHIINETQCLGLLNVNHLSNKVEIRQSTMVLFYFTDLYL